MLFRKNLNLGHIITIGAISVILIVVNIFSPHKNWLHSGGTGLYYAVLMLYRHYELLKHDGMSGPLEDADERSTSIAHEAGYRTFRYMLGITFLLVYVPGITVFSMVGVATFLVNASITIYTLIELHLRTEDASEAVSS